MRKICIEKNNLCLLYTSLADRALIYNMAVEDEQIRQYLFEDSYSLEEFLNESDEDIFFSGKQSPNNYLLIEFYNDIVGTISHAFNDARIKNMELDIWLRSTKFTGRQLGPRVISLLIDYLSQTYNIKTFLIRPSIKNIWAVRAYSKCGFRYITDFNASLYYTPEGLTLWGEGDYDHDTYNMILQL